MYLNACQIETPQADDSSQSPKFVHANFLQNKCTECHETDRPKAFKGLPHGGGKNCEQCHLSKDDKSGWLPRRSYTHKPDPSSCLDCHVKERPDPPKHPAEPQECATCHKYPKWLPLKS